MVSPRGIRISSHPKRLPERLTDSVWEQTKRELQGTSKPQALWATSALKEYYLRATPQKKYDAEKVDRLKQTLLETLKHARNIRYLDAADWVVVAVYGSGAGRPTGQRRVVRVHTATDGKAVIVNDLLEGRKTTMVHGWPLQPGSGRPHVLTVRAKKSDIDAFGEGKLSFDEWSRKAMIFAH